MSFRRQHKQDDGGNEFLYHQRNKTIKEQRRSLPIFKLKNDFLKIVTENQTVVVLGETGSGKTTQIPQYLVGAGFGENGIIGCTQPRRVAASSVANRVSTEYGCELGNEVGYTIRFVNLTGPETVIKYMTDGILLHECLKDSFLNAYSVIMLDEAHERTINTDVLFGLLKGILKKRKDLKLLICSATLDKEKFSRYFDNAPVFEIPGRPFTVDIHHVGIPPGVKYTKAAETKIVEIHRKEPIGDILVFLTGQEDIDELCVSLAENVKKCGSLLSTLMILPLYGTLDTEDQNRVLERAPSGTRKVIVATNIAESSLTIDGIVYVLDSGLVKQKMHKPNSGIDSLEITQISQAQAEQRAGRAGRTAPGKCFRLYSEEVFDRKMLKSFEPEILRSNLANIVLKLKAMGIDDVANFDFMDKPSAEAINTAVVHLHMIEALNNNQAITNLGRKMAMFPLDPCLAKLLILSAEMGCSAEVLIILSILTAPNNQKLFRRPRNRKTIAEMKHSRFHQPEGDLLTLLQIYRTWTTHHYSEDWCFNNYLSVDVLQSAKDIRNQLVHFMDFQKVAMISCGESVELVQKAICAGFFYNAACRRLRSGVIHQNAYTLLNDEKDEKRAFIRSGSSLFADRPQWVVYCELMQMSGKFLMINITKIEPSWLNEVAPNSFELNGPASLPVFKKTKMSSIARPGIRRMFESMSLT